MARAKSSKSRCDFFFPLTCGGLRGVFLARADDGRTFPGIGRFPDDESHQNSLTIEGAGLTCRKGFEVANLYWGYCDEKQAGDQGSLG